LEGVSDETKTAVFSVLGFIANFFNIFLYWIMMYAYTLAITEKEIILRDSSADEYSLA
jgi:hypothetical protein